jgi:hypothetical protein
VALRKGRDWEARLHAGPLGEGCRACVHACVPVRACKCVPVRECVQVFSSA